MALVKIQLYPGMFIYRCDSYPFEYPKNPVKEGELPMPPSGHQCEASTQPIFDTEDILKRGN